MRFLSIIPFALLVWMAPASAASKPELVDPSLFHAASSGGFRALVFRECSREHCWTRVLVQTELPESIPARIRCTSEVKELGYGSFVTDATWQAPESAALRKATLSLRVSPSHGGFEPYEAKLTVGDDCSYKIEQPRPAG